MPHAPLRQPRVRYGIFEQRNATFEALVGDYAALPRSYGLDQYLQTTQSREVTGLVWHQFIAEDRSAEIAWAERLAASAPMPVALVGLADFADPDLPRRLDAYGDVPGLSAVRQHLAWDEKTPLRRMAARPDFMRDPSWLNGLSALAERGLRCGLEVFSPQLPDLLEVVRSHPKSPMSASSPASRIRRRRRCSAGQLRPGSGYHPARDRPTDPRLRVCQPCGRPPVNTAN